MKDLTKKVSGKKETVWFCGCERKWDGTATWYKWDYKPQYPDHKKRFNYKEKQMEYICHKTGKYLVDKYIRRFYEI